MGKHRYHLIPDTISDDTVDALRTLLEDAQSGRIIGLAFAVMYRPSRDNKPYAVDTAGECRRSPTFTRGMVAVLDDLLKDDIRQGVHKS